MDCPDSHSADHLRDDPAINSAFKLEDVRADRTPVLHDGQDDSYHLPKFEDDDAISDVSTNSAVEGTSAVGAKEDVSATEDSAITEGDPEERSKHVLRDAQPVVDNRVKFGVIRPSIVGEVNSAVSTLTAISAGINHVVTANSALGEPAARNDLGAVPMCHRTTDYARDECGRVDVCPAVVADSAVQRPSVMTENSKLMVLLSRDVEANSEGLSWTVNTSNHSDEGEARAVERRKYPIPTAVKKRPPPVINEPELTCAERWRRIEADTEADEDERRRGNADVISTSGVTRDDPAINSAFKLEDVRADRTPVLHDGQDDSYHLPKFEDDDAISDVSTNSAVEGTSAVGAKEDVSATEDSAITEGDPEERSKHVLRDAQPVVDNRVKFGVIRPSIVGEVNSAVSTLTTISAGINHVVTANSALGEPAARNDLGAVPMCHRTTDYARDECGRVDVCPAVVADSAVQRPSVMTENAKLEVLLSRDVEAYSEGLSWTVYTSNHSDEGETRAVERRKYPIPTAVKKRPPPVENEPELTGAERWRRIEADSEADEDERRRGNADVISTSGVTRDDPAINSAFKLEDVRADRTPVLHDGQDDSYHLPKFEDDDAISDVSTNSAVEGTSAVGAKEDVSATEDSAITEGDPEERSKHVLRDAQPVVDNRVKFGVIRPSIVGEVNSAVSTLTTISAGINHVVTANSALGEPAARNDLGAVPMCHRTTDYARDECGRVDVCPAVVADSAVQRPSVMTENAKLEVLLSRDVEANSEGLSWTVNTSNHSDEGEARAVERRKYPIPTAVKKRPPPVENEPELICAERWRRIEADTEADEDKRRRGNADVISTSGVTRDDPAINSAFKLEDVRADRTPVLHDGQDDSYHLSKFVDDDAISDVSTNSAVEGTSAVGAKEDVSATEDSAITEGDPEERSEHILRDAQPVVDNRVKFGVIRPSIVGEVNSAVSTLTTISAGY
ncbi:hypothetical protein PInf_017865 [Phytophthora infestans]|nr:hypothetical protein PInf_017865 [Phytophthora infestans]